MLPALLAFALAAGTAGEGGPSYHDSPNYVEVERYDGEADAERSFAEAKMRAEAADKHLMAIFGANWCHDSRGLAGLLETERFAALVDAEYEVVHIDVGTPQIGEGRNLDIPGRYGVTDITGTPTVLVFAPDGTLLNADTARSWRNATSRTEDAIYAEFALLATLEAR